jgi:hypothetical protein
MKDYLGRLDFLDNLDHDLGRVIVTLLRPWNSDQVAGESRSLFSCAVLYYGHHKQTMNGGYVLLTTETQF